MPTQTNSLPQDLEEIHSHHLASLKRLHSSELASLHSALQAAQDRCRAQEGEVEALKEQVGVLRQAFEMVKERLRGVLVEQDELVEMLRMVVSVGDGRDGKESKDGRVGIGKEGAVGSRMDGASRKESMDWKRLQGELEELEKIYGLTSSKGDDLDGTSSKGDGLDDGTSVTQGTSQSTSTQGTSQSTSTQGTSHPPPQSQSTTTNQSLPPKYLLHSIKYLRKLQSADPLYLSRLLGIPFSPSKPFLLADSLLSTMLQHARAADSGFSGEDQNQNQETETGRLVRLMVCEMVQGRREALRMVQRMIEGGMIGIEEFVREQGDGDGEASVIRIALKSSASASATSGITGITGTGITGIMNLLSKFGL